MIFEQLVRPFQSRPVTTTRRIVPSVATGETGTAILIWGAAGDVPPGVLQVQGVDLDVAGFTVNKCESEEWQQTELPETEDKRISNVADDNIYIDVKRVTSIKFKKRDPDTGFGGFSATPINSTVGDGVAQTTAGLKAAMPGAWVCNARYKMDWGD